MKLVRLIQMCLTETYSRVRVGRNLSDMLLFLGKGLQPVLHQTAYHGIFTVLMYKLERFNPYRTNVENTVSS